MSRARGEALGRLVQVLRSYCEHRYAEEMRAEISAAIDRAPLQSSRFDELNCSFPDGTPTVLTELIGYLSGYLLKEKGLTVKRVLALMATALPPKGRKSHFRSVPLELEVAFENEGIRVAIDILNSIASALRLIDRQKVRLLLSGTDGVRGAKVREGGGNRGVDTREAQQSRVRAMQDLVEETARMHPDVPYREIARLVARSLGCHERTIRRNVQDPRMKGSRDTTE